MSDVTINSVSSSTITRGLKVTRRHWVTANGGAFDTLAMQAAEDPLMAAELASDALAAAAAKRKALLVPAAQMAVKGTATLAALNGIVRRNDEPQSEFDRITHEMWTRMQQAIALAHRFYMKLRRLRKRKRKKLKRKLAKRKMKARAATAFAAHDVARYAKRTAGLKVADDGIVRARMTTRLDLADLPVSSPDNSLEGS